MCSRRAGIYFFSVTFLERLLNVRQSDPGAVEQFVVTHPATEERIAAVEQKIQEL